MLYDTTVRDACFTQGREPPDIEGIISRAREQLGRNGDRPWRLISARRRFGKVLFEVEEESPAGPTRLIGKLGRTERIETLCRALASLWDAGFCPPARCTVTKLIGCNPEAGFVLQEKAPGHQVSDLMITQPANAAADSARWLATLHGSGIAAPAAANNSEKLSLWARELATALPEQAARIDHIARAVHKGFARPPGVAVPSHGDFHPMNIFVAENGRITGIDIDKFSMAERESDVGYFLMQAGAFGFFANGTFECTADARREFLEKYEAYTGKQISRERAGMYMATAFLKNLHFELVLLDTHRTEFVEPWLSGAAAAADAHLDFGP